MNPAALEIVEAVKQHAPGDRSSAETIYEKIVAGGLEHPEFLNLLGALCFQTGKSDLAIPLLQQAIALDSEDPNYCANLGAVWRALENWEAAEDYLQRALRLEPGHRDALRSLGKLLRKLDRFAEAEEILLRSLALEPDHTETILELGHVLCWKGDWEKAARLFERALSIDPNLPAAWTALGALASQEARDDEAMANYMKALSIDTDFAAARFNLGCQLLLRGDFERGWEEFLQVRRCEEEEGRTFPGPIWDGKPAPDRALVILAEQGFGDMMQLIRYAPLLRERVASVIVQVPPSLYRLLQNAPGIDRVLLQGEPIPENTLHLPLMDLPRVFGTKLETIPANIPYLRASTPIPEKIAQHLNACTKRKIGIAWKGNPRNIANHRRSIPTEELFALASMPNVQFFSLQKGVPAEETAALSQKLPFFDCAPFLQDFADTASVIDKLDLILCVDTAVAHLAGAMGKPVILLLSFAPEWRWMREREDSPWYPTMQIRRQKKLGNWRELLTREIAAAPRLAEK